MKLSVVSFARLEKILLQKDAFMVRPLPDDSPYLTPDRLRIFARLILRMSWRDAIQRTWPNDRPKKAELRMHIMNRYDHVTRFREVWAIPDN
jgi:hypothetical protein